MPCRGPGHVDRPPWKPRASAVISELAVLCRRSDGRQVAGRAALAARAGGSTATWPVRDGVVRDYFTCVHLLRLLTADLALPPHTMYPVLVGVPATATSRQRNLLVASVRRAVCGRVSSVEEPLAAASACRPGPSETDLVVADIWAGRIEVARIRGRNVAADARRLCSSPRPSGQAASAAAHRLRSGDSRRRRPAGLADWPAAVAARRLTGLPSPRHAVFSGGAHGRRVRPLPGIGTCHTFTTAAGRRGGVVTHHAGGSRELIHGVDGDPDASCGLTLTRAEAIALAGLLGILYVVAMTADPQAPAFWR